MNLQECRTQTLLLNYAGKENPDLKEICHSLNISTNHVFKTDHSNRTILNYKSGPVKFLRVIKDISQKVVPSRLITPIKNYTKNKLYKMPENLSKRLKEELFTTCFSEDVKRLEELTELDLSIWK